MLLMSAMMMRMVMIVVLVMLGDDNDDYEVTIMLIPPIYFLTAKPGICNRDQFKCRSGECIKSSFVCDNVGDCSDKSDEEYCPNGKCSLKEIYCPASQTCLNRTLQCNKIPDCSDYSDEVHCGGRLLWIL